MLSVCMCAVSRLSLSPLCSPLDWSTLTELRRKVECDATREMTSPVTRIGNTVDRTGRKDGPLFGGRLTCVYMCMCARSLESMQRVELLIESSERDEEQRTANGAEFGLRLSTGKCGGECAGERCGISSRRRKLVRRRALSCSTLSNPLFFDVFSWHFFSFLSLSLSLLRVSVCLPLSLIFVRAEREKGSVAKMRIRSNRSDRSECAVLL